MIFYLNKDDYYHFGYIFIDYGDPATCDKGEKLKRCDYNGYHRYTSKPDEFYYWTYAHPLKYMNRNMKQAPKNRMSYFKFKYIGGWHEKTKLDFAIGTINSTGKLILNDKTVFNEYGEKVKPLAFIKL